MNLDTVKVNEKEDGNKFNNALEKINAAQKKAIVVILKNDFFTKSLAPQLSEKERYSIKYMKDVNLLNR